MGSRSRGLEEMRGASFWCHRNLGWSERGMGQLSKHLGAGYVLLKRVNDCQQEQQTDHRARHQRSAATSCGLGLRTLERKGSTCSPKEKTKRNLTFLLAIFDGSMLPAATLAAPPGSVDAGLTAPADDARPCPRRRQELVQASCTSFGTYSLPVSAELVDRGDKKGGCEVLTKQWALVDNTDGELSSPSHPLASTPSTASSILAPRRFPR
jgi:hypothetical protein